MNNTVNLTEEENTGSGSTRIMRKGKTARDKASGAYTNRFKNQDARDAWYKDTKNGKVGPFPEYAARGKGNSSKAFKLKPGKRSKAA